MAIAGFNVRRDRQRPRVRPSVSNVDDNPNRDVTQTAMLVDSDTKLSDTIDFISGSVWKVDYYNALRAVDDTPTTLDVSLPQSMQSYDRIRGMVLKVQTPLDVSRAEDATGTAIMYGGILPSVGDVIVATLAGNRRTLLEVTSTEKKHYNNNTVYELTYRIDSFIDDDPTRYKNLESKVVGKFAYDDDYKLGTSGPIILEERKVTKTQILSELEDIKNLFYRVAVDRKLNIIRIPNQNIIITDPYIEDFVFFVMGYDIGGFDTIHRTTDGIEFLPEDSIWRTLIEQDISILSVLRTKLSLMSTTGVKFSPFVSDMFIGNIIPKPSLYQANVTDDLLPNFSTDDYSYLFTATFYEEPSSDSLSVLEKLVVQLLRKEPIVLDMLMRLVDTYKYWTPLEQFYYLPVLVILIEQTIYEGV